MGVFAFLGCVLLVLVSGVLAFSDGMILPDHPERGWLTVSYHRVEVSIHDGLVTTRVDQEFRNDRSELIEGRYVFPLPEGAVVSDFSMWVDGEKLEAKILPADEARAIYEDYVRRVRDPALLEYIGRDTLSARVFPIPPDGRRRIVLSYTQVLTADNGLYRYRYPLDTERFSARPLENVTIDVDLRTSGATQAIYSPTHKITVVRQDDLRATVHYAEEDVLPTRDFVLYYSVHPDELGMTLFTYRQAGEDGFFMLVFSPRVAQSPSAVVAKDLVLVLDRSGSMFGEKIAQAKEALTFVLRHLNPEDRFAVVAFSDLPTAQSTRLQPVSSSAVSDAIAWVNRLEADGGTNIDGALSTALALFDERARPRFLVFLTDGEATVGETDPLTITQDTATANAAGARIFCFGVGYGVNTFLLDRIAAENHGTSVYVEPGENLERALSGFYQKIASPVLTSPSLAISGVDIDDLYPRTLPDLFRGSQLLVLGRFREAGEARITLSGTVEDRVVSMDYVRTFPRLALSDEFLPRVWAGRKIAALLDQIRLYGESEELVDAVIRLSTRYGIITPYTSFLVEEEGLSPREMADALSQAAAAPASGQKAVAGATSVRTLAEEEAIPPEEEAVRIVGERTFFLKDGVWTESSYDGEETIDVAAFGPGYFELLSRFPEVAPILALGEDVLFALDSLYVHVGAQGAETLPEEIARLAG